MKRRKHRVGIGFEPRSPSGLMEHSPRAKEMEDAFQNKIRNKIFALLIRFSTSNRMLTIARGASGGKIIKIPMNLIDIIATKLDKGNFEDVHGAKQAFLGRITGAKYRSALGGYIIEIVRKYIADWTNRQIKKIRIEPPKRKLGSITKTYMGWKQLRESLQPDWEVFPKDPKHDIVKIFSEDTMNPRERMKRLIKGKDADRVAYGPLWDWGVAFMGGSNLWKLCYDGIETGWASVNVWFRIGGADFLPTIAPTSAYSYPLPDAHSRFFFDWRYPSDNNYPQNIEKELLKSYDDLYDYGMVGLAQEISKRMIRDTIILLREILYSGKVTKHYFGPYMRQFLPYAQLMFATWDILPMWRSMLPFLRDMRKKPEVVIEAFEFLNKPLTDVMISLGKLFKAKTALIGNSRGSNSWISPKMFEDIFWPSMKYTFKRCFENKIIPFCHFDNDWTDNMSFLAEKLPKRSCVFHLDQVDLVKVHDIIGDHFCLMGGMSPGLLVKGSPQRVEEETKRYIENIRQDGLIIASGCEFPADTPIQNVYAQKRAIKKYGFF